MECDDSLPVPKEILAIAKFLYEEGYTYSEAYPLHKWRKKGWREDMPFHQAIDACIKVMKTLEKL